MSYLTVKLSESPEIARLIRAADPTYRKRDASIRVTNSVCISGTYWDGGSRSSYHAVNLSNRKVSSAPQYAPPQFGGPAADHTVTLPAGAAIVRTGVFCGKPATAAVFLNPADVAHLLPGAV
jgi:hypothetical protein